MMFVCALKMTKKQLISLMVCLIVLIVAIILSVAKPDRSTSAWRPIEAGSEEQRQAFLASLGYEVDSPEVEEVLLPEVFDEVLEQYNALQAEGMDLKPYHGKRVKVWSYQVRNYPVEGEVLAHLYLYENKIIGGDICSPAMDGFMHGLSKMEIR